MAYNLYKHWSFCALILFLLPSTKRNYCRYPSGRPTDAVCRTCPVMSYHKNCFDLKI